MGEPLPKNYQPSEIEPRWYSTWTQANYFQAAARAPYPPYCIAFPPPNITGSLHLGHALTVTIQDALIRWRRMQGYNALWIPGSDHAGIATQTVVERELRQCEGKTRHDLGREEFLQRVWEWKEKYGSRISEQLRLLGASLDWSRECFTLDEQRSRAVRHAFVRLYEEGLIYRAERLINWCPQCRTALSDLEVESCEAQGELFHFAYPLEGGGEIVVATTRPETMLGDTAVAVHPNDARYQAMVGRLVIHPLVNRKFVVIADATLVDAAFGTGAVKVTPAHDPNDFEAGRRNNLATINILNPDGSINQAGGSFVGLDRFLARKRVVEALTQRGLDRGTTPHTIPVPRCQRCETIVEPMLSLQWFVRTEPLAKPCIEAVERGQMNFVPEGWTKTYYHWMRNIRDWCISRQLWWGHRIPAWYCPSGHVTVSESEPARCSECGAELVQDDDVLDTWFSSGLWPFSTLGWPEQTADLRTFYPNSVMETGYDILFFWVARMMMLGQHFLGGLPFRTVLLHSMIVDEKGDKMSKVRGNVIDPADVVAQHGADALRFALVWLSTPAAQGRPVKLSIKRIEESRHFCTKMWNAARFALMNLDGFDADSFVQALNETPQALNLSLADRWILSRLQRTAAEAGETLEQFRLNDTAKLLHGFFWGELCDWYLEMAKPALRGSDAAKRAAQGTLASVLETTLRLLHPLMPFITEEIWQKLPRADGAPQSLMITLYPTSDDRLVDATAENSITLLQRLTTEIREIRAMYQVPANVRLTAMVVSPNPWVRTVVVEQGHLVLDLARLSALEATAERPAPDKQQAVAVLGDLEILVGPVDVAAERARLRRKLDKAQAELSAFEKKLSDEAFRARAPTEVVSDWEQRARELTEETQRLQRAVAG